MTGQMLPGEGTVDAVIAGAADWACMTGDCMALLATLPADASIIADPPWGVDNDCDYTRLTLGRKGHKNNTFSPIAGDSRPFDPAPWLGFSGSVVLWGYQHFARALPPGTVLVWVKKRENMLGAFLSDAELGWVRGGVGCYVFNHLWSGLCRDSEVGPTLHPSQKPVALMRWAMMRAKVPARGLVVDPYAGSGSTGVAAIQTGRRVILCEINEGYAAICRKRCAAAWTARESQPALPTMDGPRERARQGRLELEAQP